MSRSMTKAAIDVDDRLNAFLAKLLNPPVTIQEVKQLKIPLPELTIDVSANIWHNNDTVH